MWKLQRLAKFNGMERQLFYGLDSLASFVKFLNPDRPEPLPFHANALVIFRFRGHIAAMGEVNVAEDVEER